MYSLGLADACLYLVAIVTFTSAKNVDFVNCFKERDMGKAVSVDVSPCSVEPCVLKHGSNVTFALKFTPRWGTKEVKAIAHGIVFDVPLPFPIPNSNGCTDSGLTCPLKIGSEVTYHSSFPIKSMFRHLDIKIKYELRSGLDVNLACIEVPAIIT